MIVFLGDGLQSFSAFISLEKQLSTWALGMGPWGSVSICAHLGVWGGVIESFSE